MPPPPSRKRSNARLKQKASSIDPAAGRCRWCPSENPKPSQAATRYGLSTTMCRAHVDHLSRHGHPLKPSYTAAEIGPLENLAKRWLKLAQKKCPSAPVANALARTRTLLMQREDSGAALPAKHKDKARAVLGRLYTKYCGERWEGFRSRWPRKRTLDELALEVAAMGLAIELAHALDPTPCSNPRYVETQIGKMLFRRGGGWLRRSVREDQSKTEYMPQPDGRLVRGPAVYLHELNRYGISRGPALKLLGKEVRDSIEFLWEAEGTLLEAVARERGLARISNWVEAQRAGVTSKRGGKRPSPRPSNPSWRPHDKVRKLSRNI